MCFIGFFEFSKDGAGSFWEVFGDDSYDFGFDSGFEFVWSLATEEFVEEDSE